MPMELPRTWFTPIWKSNADMSPDDINTKLLPQEKSVKRNLRDDQNLVISNIQ